MKKLFKCIKNYFFCKKYPFWKITDMWYMYNTCLSDKRIGSKNFFVNYSYTWYNDIPTGWQKAFGKKLSNEIKAAGKKYLKEHKDKKWKDILEFQQIKEKWGELCLYASAIKEIRDILDKYELMSSCYCICCGKPARYLTEGWVSFQCEKCFEKNECWTCDDKLEKIPLTYEKMLDYKAERRLSKKDIPTLNKYDYKLLKTESFSNKEECIKKYNELWDDPNRSEDEYYKKIGDCVIEYRQQIKHTIDLKEEYGIDFEEMWGLKD